MNGVGVLLGLLVIAYVGSILVSGRTIRGFGLPSGAEYLILGVVVGPHVLGVVERSAIVTFEPVLMVGISWVALLAGLGFRHVGKRAVHPGRAALGIALSLVVGAAVAAAAYLVSSHYRLFEGADLGWASLGAAMVACETTRHTIRWVAERHGARGPLSDLLADMARASAVVPIAVLAFICAALPAESNYYTSLSARLGITVGVGVILGAVVAVLLGREFRQQESWGLMIGTSLLGMGIASRLGLSPLGTCFVLGLTISIVSRHHADIRALAQPTEKPVMLPVLLAGGVYLDLDILRSAAPLIVAVLVARVLADLLRGLALSGAMPAARRAGPLLGLGFVSTGPMSIAVALGLAIRSHSTPSAFVFAVAVVGVLFGELIGPASLRRALERAGETHAVEENETHPLASIPPPRVAPSHHPEGEGS